METIEAGNKIAELLKPRYKVIATFPYMTSVGDSGFAFGEIFYPEFKYGKYFFNEVSIDGYPHLFKKLEWWENRKESEMLGYVKTAFGICKVVKHFVSKYSDIKTGQQCVIDDGQFERALYYNTLQPATEEEFNSQNKKEV